MTDLENQTYALIAAYHSAIGICTLAAKGQWPEANYAALLPSLTHFNCANLPDYYDKHQQFEPARQALIETFGHGVPDDNIRYLMQMLSVERRLSKKPELMADLKIGLEQAQTQSQHFSALHDNLFAKYADIYQQTASLAARKILVRGNPLYLQNSSTAARIRTLLLCGIRAASLWRGAGGSRSQIIFGRKAIVDTATSLAL